MNKADWEQRRKLAAANIIIFQAEDAHIAAILEMDEEVPYMPPPSFWNWGQGMAMRGWEWYDVKERWVKGKAYIHVEDAAKIYAEWEYPEENDGE